MKSDDEGLNANFEMPQFARDDEVVAEMYAHVIFWTRKLRPALTPEMLARACEEMDQAMFAVQGEALAAGGAAEHLHILVRASPEHTVAETIEALRRRCEAWVAPDGKKVAWSENDVALSLALRTSTRPERSLTLRANITRMWPLSPS